MTGTFAHVRYALRQFRLAPAFTVTAVLTLALGIGGTTAIYTLIDAVMLRSLPVSDPATLYRVGEGDDCCVQGGPQDKWGFYLLVALPAPQSCRSRVRRSHRIPGRPGPRQRPPQRIERTPQTPPLRIC